MCIFVTTLSSDTKVYRLVTLILIFILKITISHFAAPLVIQVMILNVTMLKGLFYGLFILS